MSTPPLYAHQQATVDFCHEHACILDLSDPGTGKTRAHLTAFSEALAQDPRAKALVLAPKSILYPAWGADIEQFLPHLRYATALASNRAKAFAIDADIHITNHDAVNWLAKNPRILAPYTDIIIDEFTAFKNPNSGRSKALRSIIDAFERRRGLSGTPDPNTVLDFWHPMLLIDGGQRLGNSFWKFRSAVCAPTQVGPQSSMIKWEDRPGVEDSVAMLLSDIVIRHRFEDCVDIPPNVTHYIPFTLEPTALRAYNTLKHHAMLELQSGTVQAVHAASLAQKLLQLASGAVYDNNGDASLISTARYELILDLVRQRSHSVVAFNWTHQRDELTKLADKQGVRYAVIDGAVKYTDRLEAVRAFQNGELQVIFAHPQSAGHGLTLTRGTATIWASPTYNAEHFQQFNCRIYRAGQTQKTETILIAAEGTLETAVYDKLNGKLDRMNGLLDLLQTPTPKAA